MRAAAPKSWRLPAAARTRSSRPVRRGRSEARRSTRCSKGSWSTGRPWKPAAIPRRRICSRSVSAVVSLPRYRWGRGRSECSGSSGRRRTASRRRRSSSSTCSVGSSRQLCRTSARTRRSAAPRTSYAVSPRYAPTSSRSSRTSSAVRWRR